MRSIKADGVHLVDRSSPRNDLRSSPVDKGAHHRERRGCRTKLKRPKATRSIAAAGTDCDGALERPGCRIEGVDLAGDKAEIADQQVAAKLTETGRSQGNAPGRDERAADDRLQQVPAAAR